MRLPSDKHRFVKASLYLTVLVLLNAASFRFFFHLDLTRNKRFSLSETSRRVVATLSEPMIVKVFFTRRLPAPYNGVRRYLHDLLAEYAIYGKRYFDYRFYDVDPQEGQPAGKTSANRALALDYGIEPIQIQTIEKDEVKFQKAFMGIVLIHGDTVEKLPAVTSTDDLEYRLTTAMEKLARKVSALLALEKPLEVVLYLSSSLDQVAGVMGIGQLDSYSTSIKKAVAELNSGLYDKLEFKIVDPSGRQSDTELIDRYRLPWIKWPAMDERKIKAGRGTIGLVVRNSKRWKAIPLLKVVRMPLMGTRYRLVAPEQVKRLIDLNLNVLLGINAELGYLADHGTPPLGSSSLAAGGLNLQRFADLAGRNYDLVPVKLEQGVPAGLKCLLIVRPTRKFSDWELYQLDQALMRGTNLAFFIDPLEEKPSSGTRPKLAEIDTGLDKLLHHWGVAIEKAIVLDKQCYRQVMPQAMGGGQRPIYFAPLLHQENISGQLPFLRHIKQLVVFKAAPVNPLNEKLEKQGLTAYKLLSSSQSSWTVGRGAMLVPELLRVPATAELSSRPLAYLLKGRFTSYFKGKPLPQKSSGNKEQDKKGEKAENHSREPEARVSYQGVTIDRSPPAQLFVMGSAQMLSNILLDSEGKSNNAVFVMNLIDALNGRQDRALMRGKLQRLNPLHRTSPELKSLIKAFCIAGLPLGVIFCGLGVWLYRRRRQKRILESFGRRQEQ